MDEKAETKSMGQVIQIDEARIRDHLSEMVRGTVEEALNAMLDAELTGSAAPGATSAARAARTPERATTSVRWRRGPGRSA